MKIFDSIALVQFAASRANTEHLFARSGAAQVGVNNRAPETPPARKKGKLSPAEDAQLDRLLNSAASPEVIPAERRPQPHGGDLKSGKDRQNADISEASGSLSEDELSKLDIAQLTKKEAVLRVLAKQLEVDEKTGTLIKRKEVETALFVVGQEIRLRVEAIPSRVIDSILAAPTRADAVLILNKEINSALTLLSGLADVQLSKRKNNPLH